MVSLLSSIYTRLTDLRNARFDSGRSRSFNLGARTISVGNITTGGTGKTPLVTLIASKLAARGERVCILTRGYGRSNPKNQVLVSDGARVLTDTRHGGDEPVEMARALLGKAVVIADRDRVAAASWAKEKLGITVFILDDGFQHRRALRDVDIVCIDALDPFGGGRVLPSGRLREPLSNLKRATAVVITRSDFASDIDEIKSVVRRNNEHCPIFTARTVFGNTISLGDYLDPEVHEPNGSDRSAALQVPAYAFCALGNPEAFFGQLRRDNFNIAGTYSFRDHFAYRQLDVTALAELARRAGATCLLTTAKDAVKLESFEFEIPCFVIEARMELNDDADFSSLL